MKKNQIIIRFILRTFILLIFSVSFSQNLNTDSLYNILNTHRLSKKERAQLLSELAFNHRNLDTALFFAKESLKIATDIENPTLEGEAWEEISHIEHRLGNNTISLKASLNALKIYQSLQLTERQAATYTQLANNYMSNQDFLPAIKYLKKAIQIYTDSKEIGFKTGALHNLGEAYRLAGHLDSAAVAFKQTLKLNKLVKNEFIESYTLGNLGMVYTTQNKLDFAKKHLNDAIKILRPLEDYYSTSVYIAELGEVYKKEGNHKLAEEKFLEAFFMAKQAGLKEQIRDFSAKISGFYEEEKKFSKALEYQKLFQIYQDSLVNKENIQRIEQIKAGHEIDKRESEIGLLNTINTNQKYWVITLTIGTFLLLLFAYLLYRGNLKIKTTNIILSKREQEKAMLLRELNHRIKNNLQMISSLLNLQSHELTGHPAKEAIVSGKHRVEALSLVHRKLYQEDLDTRILLKDYIEELVLGLFHGYNAPFKPDFKIDNISVNLDTAVPLALVINEIIINALKYAYKNIDTPKLNIVMQQSKGYLDIQIIDNGVGFNSNASKKTSSFGLKLIYSLIEQLEGVIKKLDSKNGTHWKMNIKIA